MHPGCPAAVNKEIEMSTWGRSSKKLFSASSWNWNLLENIHKKTHSEWNTKHIIGLCMAPTCMNCIGCVQKDQLARFVLQLNLLFEICGNNLFSNYLRLLKNLKRLLCGMVRLSVLNKQNCDVHGLRQCLLDWNHSTVVYGVQFLVSFLSITWYIYFFCCAPQFQFTCCVYCSRCNRLTKELVAKNDFRQVVVVASNRTKLGNDTSKCTLGILRKWAERSKCWVLRFLSGSSVFLVLSPRPCSAVFGCEFRYRLDQFNFWPFARAYAIHFT